MNSSPLPQDRPIQESDLASLFSAAAREDRFIEFKSEYLPETDGGRKKFLQSVAAFANSRGGDLVLGVSEIKGVAMAFKPLHGINPDQCRIQLRDLIRLHLRPPLGGVQVEAVTISSGGHVLVVRIPKSWAGPHLLTYNDERRFYIRDDGGKRPMDYEEVRDGFLAGEATGARLRNFRLERCAAILNDETPKPLAHRSRIVLHLLPFESVALPSRFETRDLYGKCETLLPLNHLGHSRAFDIDGVFSYAGSVGKPVSGYAYCLRSGAIEAVDAGWLAPWRANEETTIPYGGIEPKIVTGVEGYLQLLAKLNVPPPYALFLSLLNIRGYFMPTGPLYADSGNPINRDHLYISEVVFDAVPNSVATALFPVFNSVWNACGWPQSLNYDEKGNWKPRQ